MSAARLNARPIPFAIHVLLLLTVLAGIGAFVGHDSSFVADEGATMIQARLLTSGGGWLEHPPLLRAVDPTGSWYPLENSDRSGTGFAPFAKHPAYAVAAAAGYRIAGPAGVIGLSVLGTLLAALAASRIAALLDPMLAVPCLWVTAVLTPLLFDSYLALGSTLAAAFAGGAVLAAMPVWIERRSVRPAVIRAVAVGLAVFAATLLRTEGTIFGVALAAVTAGGAVAWRRLGPMVLAVTALAGALGARLAETAMRRAILGTGATAPGSVGVQGGSGGHSYLYGRVQAFYSTWVVPSHPSLPRGDEALIAAWVLFSALAIVVRRRRPDPGFVTIIGTLLVAASIARLVVDRADPVPGLLIAFPAGWVGVLLLRRRDVTPAAVLCLGTAGLFCAGVAATQYTFGEWMGRFFVLAVPVAMPFLVAASARAIHDLEPTVGRVALGTGLTAAAVVGAVSIAGLRNAHRDNTRLADTIHSMRSGSAPGAQVVVTVVPWVALQAWPTYAGQQWLLVAGSPDFPLLSARLRAAGTTSVTLATIGPEDYPARFPGWRVVAQRRLDANGRPWQISALSPA